MSPLPFMPDNAPFLSEQRLWSNGNPGKSHAERGSSSTSCDVDCEAPAKTWTDGAFTALSSSPEATPPFSPASASKASAALVAAEALHGWPGRNPSSASLRGGASYLAQNFVRPEKRYQTDVY